MGVEIFEVELAKLSFEILLEEETLLLLLMGILDFFDFC